MAAGFHAPLPTPALPREAAGDSKSALVLDFKKAASTLEAAFAEYEQVMRFACKSSNIGDCKKRLHAVNDVSGILRLLEFIFASASVSSELKGYIARTVCMETIPCHDELAGLIKAQVLSNLASLIAGANSDPATLAVYQHEQTWIMAADTLAADVVARCQKMFPFAESTALQVVYSPYLNALIAQAKIAMSWVKGSAPPAAAAADPGSRHKIFPCFPG